MAVYTRQIETARRLITQKGQSIVVRHNTTVFDPATPWIPDSSGVVDHVAVAVFFPMTKDRHETVRELSDGVDITGSVWAMVAQFDATPSVGDVVLRNGVELQVLYVNTLSPNGEVIYHEVYMSGDVAESFGG